MPTPTYDLIEEQVLSTTAASVTFSSIPGTYKDLVLEIVGTSTASNDAYLVFNSDTTGNYSNTSLRGNGTAASSSRLTSTNGWIDYQTTGTGLFNYTVHIMSYASTNVFKTYLSRFSAAGTGAEALVGLWRKSPAEAITSIAATMSGTTWASGCVFRLWGVSG